MSCLGHRSLRLEDWEGGVGGVTPSIPAIHFAVGVAHWEYDDPTDEGRRWAAASS
jgi:hypothetical protein